MKVSDAVSIFIEYHSANSKKNTLKNYEWQLADLTVCKNHLVNNGLRVKSR